MALLNFQLMRPRQQAPAPKGPVGPWPFRIFNWQKNPVADLVVVGQGFRWRVLEKLGATSLAFPNRALKKLAKLR